MTFDICLKQLMQVVLMVILLCLYVCVFEMCEFQVVIVIWCKRQAFDILKIVLPDV